MEELYLKRIDITDEYAVLDFLREMVQNDSTINGIWWDDPGKDFPQLLEYLKKFDIPFENYEQENTVMRQYLLYRKPDNRLLGVFSIRPYLNRRLDETWGGNIGYSIRPTQRNKGYATEGLRQSLQIIKQINPNDKVIMCCSRDNIASARVIQKNGGVLIAETGGIIPKQKYEIII